MPYHPHPRIIICTSFISSIDYNGFIVLQCPLKDHLWSLSQSPLSNRHFTPSQSPLSYGQFTLSQSPLSNRHFTLDQSPLSHGQFTLSQSPLSNRHFTLSSFYGARCQRGNLYYNSRAAHSTVRDVKGLTCIIIESHAFYSI